MMNDLETCFEWLEKPRYEVQSVLTITNGIDYRLEMLFNREEAWKVINMIFDHISEIRTHSIDEDFWIVKKFGKVIENE